MCVLRRILSRKEQQDGAHTETHEIKTNETDGTPIWIWEAECVVPRRCTQEDRLKGQNQLRQENFQAAAAVEALPWYVKPDGPYGGDEWALFDWEWYGVDEEVWCYRTHLRIETLSQASCSLRLFGHCCGIAVEERRGQREDRCTKTDTVRHRQGLASMDSRRGNGAEGNGSVIQQLRELRTAGTWASRIVSAADKQSEPSNVAAA